jgi:S1-C subfamily serine protease
MRHYSTPRAAFRMARRYSLIGALIVAPMLLVPNYNWGMGLAIVVAPWMGALVATFPSRKKRLGEPPSEKFRFAQEAISIVQIGRAIGNGFWIGPDRLVTCFHILAADLGGRMRAHTINGTIELKIVSMDPFSDLAVLAPEDSGAAPAVLKLAEGTDDLNEGDPLVHVCYSKPFLLQPEWHEAEGSFRARGTMMHLLAGRQRGDVTEMMGIAWMAIATDLACESGQSGSPVLNKNGEVIGVVRSVSMEQPGTLVVPVEAIHEVTQPK